MGMCFGNIPNGCRENWWQSECYESWLDKNKAVSSLHDIWTSVLHMLNEFFPVFASDEGGHLQHSVRQFE